MSRTVLLAFSTLATALVVAGFGIFCLDEWGKGSRAAIERLGGEHRPAPASEAERTRERDADPVRELVSDANDVLLGPFAGVAAGSDSTWVRHGVPALIAFLVYGVALRILANSLPPPRRSQPRGWVVPR